MMREFIERFRYRFQLWRRERREDSFWRLGTDFPSPIAIDKLVRRPESLWVVPIRAIGGYLGIVVIVGQTCRLIAAAFPGARIVSIYVFVIFVCLFTLMMFRFTVTLYRAKKKLLREAAEASNQGAASRRLAGAIPSFFMITTLQQAAKLALA